MLWRYNQKCIVNWTLRPNYSTVLCESEQRDRAAWQLKRHSTERRCQKFEKSKECRYINLSKRRAEIEEKRRKTTLNRPRNGRNWRLKVPKAIAFASICLSRLSRETFFSFKYMYIHGTTSPRARWTKYVPKKRFRLDLATRRYPRYFPSTFPISFRDYPTLVLPIRSPFPSVAPRANSRACPFVKRL